MAGGPLKIGSACHGGVLPERSSRWLPATYILSSTVPYNSYYTTLLFNLTISAHNFLRFFFL